MKMLRQCLLGLSVVALCGVVLAGEPEARTVAFKIEAQPVSNALKAFADQSGLQLLFHVEGTGISQEVKSPGVDGTLTPEAALQRLLSDTGLRYEFINPRTVTIRTDKRAQLGDDVRLAQTGHGGTQSAASSTDTGKSAGSSDVDSGQASTGEKLQEIVVTAQKRKERLQDVPISISVLDGRGLDSFTGEGMQDALATVPGFKVTQDFWNGSQVSVRGVAASGGVLAGSSPVAYYIDSVPFGFVKTAIAPDTSAYDLERVEALRGPQGTLYGASALNGVVRVLTRDADLDKFELKARTSVSTTQGGDESYRGDLAVNVPVVDGRVAARAVLGYSRLGGWIDKLNASDVNDAKLSNFRLKINAKPSEELSLALTAWRSRTDRGAIPLGDERDRYDGTADAPASSDFDILGLRIGYAFSKFSISSATSYIDYSNHVVFDYTLFGLDPLYTVGQSKVVSEEILLASTGKDAWRWNIGAFYRDAKDGWDQFQTLIFNPNIDFTDRSRSFAVFGELTRRFYDGKVELTGGLRYFEDEVTQSAGSALAGFRKSNTFDNVSPRVVLTWHPVTELTTYVSYAEGFRSGFNQTPAVLVQAPNLAPAHEDSLHTYEVGAKGNLLEGRLTYDAAGYYTKWDDVQQQVNIIVPGTNGNAGLAAVVNGESASGAGFDVGLTLRPLHGLELGTSASWNDLTMDGNALSQGAILFAKGDRLALSPKYSLGASIGYVFPLGASGLEGRFASSAQYGSKLYSARSLTTAGSAHQDPAGDPLRLYNGSFSIARPNRWTLDLFVDNIANDRGAFSGAATSQLSSRPRPRTIGVQFEYSFE